MPFDGCLRGWATSVEIYDIQVLGVVCRGGGQPPLPRDCCETNVCFCKCCGKARGGKKDAIEDIMMIQKNDAIEDALFKDAFEIIYLATTTFNGAEEGNRRLGGCWIRGLGPTLRPMRSEWDAIEVNMRLKIT